MVEQLAVNQLVVGSNPTSRASGMRLISRPKRKASSEMRMFFSIVVSYKYFMKCPYPECRKDYNDEGWPPVYHGWIDPEDWEGSINEEMTTNRVLLITRRCRFCNQLFHTLSVGHQNYISDHGWKRQDPTIEPLIQYPTSKTKFEAKGVSKEVVAAFNEAERCRSVGSLTGAGSCLRKAIYTLCDAMDVSGADYRGKIVNLPVKTEYQELLKQIKWLGDNVTKPGQEKYTMDMVDVALEILPVLVDDIYIKDEKADTAAKLLARARSVNSLPETSEEQE